MAIPKTNANWSTTLSAKISATASSLTIDRSTDANGVTLAATYHVTIDEGTSKEEHMVVTFAGATGTIVTRGLDKTDSKTLVTANRFEHDRGAEVKMTDIGLVQVINRLNGSEAFDSVALTGIASVSGLTTPTSGETTKAANVEYVNNAASAGAADAAETVKGLVEAATTAEVAAGDDSGSTTAPTFVRPSKLAEVIQNGSFIYAVEDGSGSDDTYTWTTTPTTSAYTTGSLRLIKFTVANTGACTGNENSIGAKTFKKYASGALADLETGDIVAGFFGWVYYDGTYLVLLNPGATMPTTALLSEMATFFGNTDITGAEAESLTAGISSPLTTLHSHKRTYGAANCTVSGAGAQTIAHGLGVTPKWVRIAAQTGGGGHRVSSNGEFDGTTTATSYVGVTTGTATVAGTDSTYIIRCDDDASAGAGQYATIAIDATNITLTWTNGDTGTTSRATFLWECGV